MAQAFCRAEDGAVAIHHGHTPKSVLAGQGLADEDAGRLGGVDALVGHQAPIAYGETLPGHRLDAHHLLALLVPVGIPVPTLHPVARQVHNPLGIDGGAQAGEQAAGFDHLAGHQPRSGRRCLLAVVDLARTQGGAGVHGQQAFACAAVGPLLRIVHQDIAEHAREDGAVHRLQGPLLIGGSVAGQGAAVAGFPQARPQLMAHVGPFAHATEAEVGLLAEARALGAGAGPLPAVPQA